MQITIEVPDSLAAVAAGMGKTAEAYVTEVVSQSVADHVPFKPSLSPEDFVRELSKFSDKIQSPGSSAFTREEIYADHD